MLIEEDYTIMPTYSVTLEDDAGNIWESTTCREIEIGDYIIVRLLTKEPKFAWGTVIMYELIKD